MLARLGQVIYWASCLVIALGVSSYAGAAAKPDGEAPLRSVTLTVNENQQDRLFEELRKFADTEAFAIRIAPISPDGQHFSIQLWRQDVKIIGSNALSPQEFYLGFYENGDHPANGYIVGQLVTHLKRIVLQVPGISISEPN